MASFFQKNQYNESLPIFQKRSEIISTIVQNQVVIIAGETGSGKTTQLPLMCLEAGRGTKGRILCTQPRRIAAVSLAHYVAEQTATPLGTFVGYKVRFSDRLSSESKLIFATDGIVLAKIATDPLLQHYDTIIIDEAHERSLTIDFLLGYVRTLLLKRPELRCIISSATMDTRLFTENFSNAPVITVEGRLYPVTIEYKPLIQMWEGEAMRSYIDCVVATVRHLVDAYHQGSILVFMPTVQDITETVACLQAVYRAAAISVFALHSRIGLSQQARIFNSGNRRTIVIATNIAETSITVPGIRFVVDTGLARIVRWESRMATSRMPIERISRSSADQRAGRCGRVCDGICIRLYSEADYQGRPQYPTAEIKRSNLAGMILKMLSLNIGRISAFPFIQRPADSAIADGFAQLRQLGAVNEKGGLTEVGRAMARLPLEPTIARMMLSGQELGVAAEVMIIAAACAAGDIRIDESLLPQGYGQGWKRYNHPDSDFMTYLNIWRAYYSEIKRPTYNQLVFFCTENGLSFHRMVEWIEIYGQLRHLCQRPGSRGIRYQSHQLQHQNQKQKQPQDRTTALYDAIHKSLLCGLSSFMALRQDNGLFRSATEHDIAIFPTSTLSGKHPDWVVFHEIIETTRMYGRTAAVIRPRWIEELFSQACRISYEEIHFNQVSGTVQALEQVFYHDLPLIQNRRVDYSRKCPQHAHEIFITEALVGQKAGMRFHFLRHNRRLRQQIESVETKLRSRRFYIGDSHLSCFYQEKLPGVTSLRQLHAAIKLRGSDQFLCCQQEELVADRMPQTLDQFPDMLWFDTDKIPLSYVYAPDSPQDGITATVPVAWYNTLPLYYWQWLVPGLVRRRVEACLAAFLSNMTTRLSTTPLPSELIDAVCAAMTISSQPFIESLHKAVQTVLGQQTFHVDALQGSLPPHLWLRVVVVESDGQIIDEFRLPDQKPSVFRKLRPGYISQSLSWCAQWEKQDVDGLYGERLLDTILVGAERLPQPIPLVRALCVEKKEHSVRFAIRLFLSLPHGRTAHACAIMALIEERMAQSLAYLVRDVKLTDGLVYRWRAAIGITGSFTPDIISQERRVELFLNQALAAGHTAVQEEPVVNGRQIAGLHGVKSAARADFTADKNALLSMAQYFIHQMVTEIVPIPIQVESAVVESAVTATPPLPADQQAFERIAAIASNKALTSASDVPRMIEEFLDAFQKIQDLIAHKKKKSTSMVNRRQLDEIETNLNEYRDIFLSPLTPWCIRSRVPLYVAGLQKRIDCAMATVAKYRTAMQVIGGYKKAISQILRNPIRLHFDLVSGLLSAFQSVEELTIASCVENSGSTHIQNMHARIQENLSRLQRMQAEEGEERSIL
ncbi:MAG: ATP-dependent RNA helicase HrpA [Chitinivibrionales bacterium]|nr:ATP-dependent RNA helicase HrpA [Chitinivibrionales bacterium]